MVGCLLYCKKKLDSLLIGLVIGIGSRTLIFLIINGILHVLLNANTIKDGDEEAWTAMLPGRCDISDAVAYREKLFSAVPDPERTEPYRLRGKRV